MANKKITELTATTTMVAADLLPVVVDMATTPVTKKITKANFLASVGVTNINGWINPGETWAYASATTITVPSGAAAKYSIGDKIKLTQTTVKYFYVVAVADTVLTVNGGSAYTVANAAISANFYSKVATPVGFPHWFNFTPVWTNLTVGDGTNTGSFRIADGMVGFTLLFTLGSTSSVASNPFVTAPVTANNSTQLIGINAYGDTGTENYVGYTQISNQNLYAKTSAFSGVTATAPHTWASTDTLAMAGSYKI